MESAEKNSRNNVILIPTDFSEVCDNALAHGADLARYLNAKIHALHVIDKDTKAYLKKQKMGDEAIMDKLKAKAVDLTERYSVQVEYSAVEGDIFTAVGEVALEKGAKMIILGTHGKVGFQRITGSYALKVVSKSSVPTIVVQKRSFTNGYKKIIFPVSVSTQDRQKVNWAVSIAKAFDSTIHLIPKFESEEYLRRRIMSVTRQIKDIFEKYDVKHVDKVTDPKGGNFSKQVIDYAVEHEADLIMIMTSNDQVLPILDTWDEQIMFNTAQIPVICINPVSTTVFSWH